jgi:hypothetical protein
MAIIERDYIVIFQQRWFHRLRRNKEKPHAAPRKQVQEKPENNRQERIDSISMNFLPSGQGPNLRRCIERS